MGKETVDGIPYYQLSWQKGPNDEQMYWVNQETFLIEQTGEYAENKAQAGIYYKNRLKSYRPQYAIIKIAPAVPSIVGSLVE